MLKIGYIGNFTQRHCTENHVKLSLQSLGYEVVPIQENLYNADYVYETGKELDLILYTRTWGMAGLQPVLDKLYKEHKVPSASYHLDIYFGLSRSGLYAGLASKGITGIHDDPFWHTTYVFTVDGAPDSAKWFRENNINHFYMKAGVYDKECYMAPFHGYKNDIIFVGSPGHLHGYHDEWPYRHKLVSWLQETYGSRFRLVPGDGNPAVRNEELNQLYADTKVVVGDSLCPGFTHENYWSDRIYETTGRGGFIIHPWIKGIEDEFEDEVHLRLYKFNDFDGLKQMIDYYLEHDADREFIRANGHNLTKNNFTYRNRMMKILLKIGEFEPQIASKL